ncbi:MAG: hypothetical protein E6R13_09640 [Spirochaetes bacterium]|nr:MAG: hypothetical protein E6R13_09640 [Spirochaetota bacterium]
MTKKEAAELAAYKRSNKDRKKVLLERMGYKTQEEYFEAIGADKKKKAPKKVAVKVAAKKAAKPTSPTKASELTSDDSKPTDYVIAFDTTGSMSSYIRSVKDHVVIDRFSKPNKVGTELILTNVTTGEITKHPSIRSVIKTGLSNTNILGKINTGIMIKKKKTKELFTLNTLDYGKKS